MITRHAVFWLGFVIATSACAAARAAPAFKVESPAFGDGDVLKDKYSGQNSPACHGENVSPPLAWSNAPDQTKSFVLLMFDLDGRNGLGVSHQVAYGFPADKTALKEGDLDAVASFVAGRGTRGMNTYLGPCPPAGSGSHHYVFTIIATDIEPSALEPNLTREQVLDRLAGHAKAAASLVGRFGQ